MNDPVEAQLAAYNARDIDAFSPCFAEDVVAEDGEGNVLFRGRAALHERYGAMFAASPELHCHLVSRVRCGAYVLDEERVEGRGPEPIHAVAIYRVESGLIAHVRFLR